MENWREFTGKTVEDAVSEAMAALKLSSDKIEYEVVEKESKGFLGIGSKPAKIRVKEYSDANEGVAVSEVKAEKAEKPVEKETEAAPAEKKASVVCSGNPEESAKEFLDKVFKAMNINADIIVTYNKEDETVAIDLNGEDMGVLIGKRGQTLDSLQYLTSLVVNKNTDGYLKVKLDTENYRERRKETLENLAKNIASKVKRTHKAVSLEPMNPYERRIIHSTLQNDKFVETHSEGEEPYRKVVVTPKKGVREYNNDRPYNRRGRYDGGRYDNGGVKKYNKKEFHKKYGENTKDYSTDYKKDYAAYLEQKAAAKAAAENAGKEENNSAE